MKTTRTGHGDSIADQIQTEDAYGEFNNLTDADLYNILDQFQTHITDTQPDSPLVNVLGKWMDELIELNPEMELP